VFSEPGGTINVISLKIPKPEFTFTSVLPITLAELSIADIVITELESV